MASAFSRKYLIKILNKTHATHQNPLSWNINKQKFVLDESRCYQIGAWMVLALDLLNFFIFTTLAISNNIFGLDPTFTHIHILWLGISLEGIILDVSCMKSGKETREVLNASWQTAEETTKGMLKQTLLASTIS